MDGLVAGNGAGRERGRRLMERFRAFEPEHHERQLLAILDEVRAVSVGDAKALGRIVRRHPRNGNGVFSKSEIIRAFRHFAPVLGWEGEEPAFLEKLRMKPTRTLSGVTPVTVLTKPFPCPGRCVFCPNDVRMPKSYLSMEPGAQRATLNAFDPWRQTHSRLCTYHFNGHSVQKVELIILGGTWSLYPEPYQIWFVKRCFDALNEFSGPGPTCEVGEAQGHDFLDLGEQLHGANLERSYNEVVTGHLRSRLSGRLTSNDESAAWEALVEAQRRNESCSSRCVGLSLETRPDEIDEREVKRLRRLGATKIQIGYQSLSDDVLERNQRGHTVAESAEATRLLRAAGFKIQAHWMPNLLGSSPEQDIADFERMFARRDLRPDELKIYPCSLIESAELMRHHASGEWRAYSEEELLHVLVECFRRVPPYCRVTRVVRDIPSHDILAGNKTSNLRERVDAELLSKEIHTQDIRSREVRDLERHGSQPVLQELHYGTSIGEEVFLQFVHEDNRLAGFLRLGLPRAPAFIGEIEGSALLREVHVYGAVAEIGERGRRKAQHAGLGRRLVRRAEEIAAAAGFRDLAVISGVGTRQYYRRLGFTDGDLYQHRMIHHRFAPN